MLFVRSSVLVRQQLICLTLESGLLSKAWLKSFIFSSDKELEPCATRWTKHGTSWTPLHKSRNVHERLKLVLVLIIKDDSGDCYIEANQGKLFKVPSPETEELDKKKDEGEEELSTEEICTNDLDFRHLGNRSCFD